jgi:hypothetical protein
VKAVRLLAAVLLVAAFGPGRGAAQTHRAEQDREIRYWLLDPDSHRFRISHEFTITKAGQKYVHNFVRAGSAVSDSRFVDLDTGRELKSYHVTGKQVNALAYYPEASPDDAVVLQADLERAIQNGESVRVRVEETYTDAANYGMKGEELVWDRTLGRPRNEVVLPEGWALSSLNIPAVISLDEQGRVVCRFINPRPDEVHVILKALRRPAGGTVPSPKP